MNNENVIHKQWNIINYNKNKITQFAGNCNESKNYSKLVSQGPKDK